MLAATICEEKPRSQNRDLGHPLLVWLLLYLRQSETLWRDLRDCFVPTVSFAARGLPARAAPAHLVWALLAALPRETPEAQPQQIETAPR